jgi:hypothetical protein
MALLIDPLQRRITLSDRTWAAHIVKGHPEMTAHHRAALDAVTSPEEIQYSASDSDCRVYYGQPLRNGLRAVVIADVVGGWVKTAYFARKKRAGAVEWSR